VKITPKQFVRLQRVRTATPPECRDVNPECSVPCIKVIAVQWHVSILCCGAKWAEN